MPTADHTNAARLRVFCRGSLGPRHGRRVASRGVISAVSWFARKAGPGIVLAALFTGCAATRPSTDSAATGAALPTAGTDTPPRATMDAKSGAAAPAPAPAVTAPTPAEEPRADLWMRLRAGFSLPDVCQAKPQTRRWARVYTRHPQMFERELARVAAEIEFVADIFARRGVPLDFALLPWVESRFRAVETSGNRPAGVWQFMPATAREFGLAVGPGYDARLDLYAATLAAASLLEHLGASFDGDWRLACMAFNAGEFRVRRAIARHKTRTAPLRVEDLPLSPITHEHLAKLEALGCLVRYPDRYGIELPAISDGARLRVVALPGPIDRDLAWAMTGIDEAQFARLNPTLRAPLLPAGRHLLLPQSALSRWQTLAAGLPVAQAARDWRMSPLGSGGSSADGALLDRNRDIDPSWLAMLNEGAETRGHLLLPPLGERAAVQGPHAVANSERYRVRRGDTAWTIARRFGVRLDALLRANGLGERSILRPGQWLRIPR